VSEPLRRLTDGEPAPGSVEAEGVALLRARGRHRAPVAQKARVRAALEARAGFGAASRWRTAAVAVSFAGILLVAGAASSTSFGRQWVGAHVRRVLAWAGPRAASAPVARIEAPAQPIVPTPTIVEMPVALPAETPPPAPAVAPVSPRPMRAAPPRAELRAPARASAPVITDEPTLVATAMRTLRRDHDPAGAALLLDGYLRRWPNGALIEEALALAIEAANARGDARAHTFAAQYLQRFPNGRFAEVARRTLAHAAP
jgi:hypothetical protein